MKDQIRHRSPLPPAENRPKSISVPYLFMSSFSDVEDFSLEREHAVMISADHGKAGNRQGFGGISLRQDESAEIGILRPRVVGVFQFCHSFQLRVLF